MVKKIAGYLLALVGLAGVAFYTFPEYLPANLPLEANSGALIGLSIILLLIGIFFVVSKGKSNQQSEVPIFHGKDVVGYRRH